ncbi:MAG: zinc-dependent metalloprotease [Cyclobacteriaceae bacterium]
MKNLRTMLMLLLAVVMLIGTPAEAQKKKKKKKKGETEAPKKKEEKKTLASETKKHMKFDGLFTIYQDSTTGKTKMLIKEDQIGKEFIYFGQVKDGVTEAGAFRGAYDGEFIFKINKYFNRLEFEKVNTNFYFEEGNPLKKSADANISRAIMASEEVIVEEDGVYLIDADNLFAKETLSQVKSDPSNPKAFKLGSASKDKTKIISIKNYPENLNIAVQYAYDNSQPKNRGSDAVTDARYVTVEMFYTLLKVPENDYEPRFDDPRVGYFLNEVEDQTSTSATPYRDMINRWHLKKKDPNAAVSDPVEPITWWMENTTPVEWRETIKEGVLAWNEAFEAAGFSNAMVVKMQPDDADWDAGDIRYNVLRWTSSPNPPFGGYGPSFTNPRTGQILGADIMLEFVHFANRVKYDGIYNLTASENDFEPAFGKGNNKFCSYGDFMQENLLFGRLLAGEAGADDYEMTGIKKEAMIELILHEVGHTLGLNHNMKASQLHSPAELVNNKSGVLTGSVMDYVATNVTKDRSKQGNYYSTKAGPYDKWAIQFGYMPFANDSERSDLLARSTEPELIFGNDADDMRSAGKAIDPRVNTGDLSSDAIQYSVDIFETVRNLMDKLKEETLEDGDTYQELRQNFYILSRQYAGASRVISRYIGGIYVDRALVGQEGGVQPFTPVSYADQKRAMAALSKYVFAPNAWQAPEGLYNYLAMQRRGYGFYAAPEDPKIHDLMMGIQNQALTHLLHPNTMQRLVDSELYGNEYDLGEMMTALNNAIMKADISGTVNTFRQNLQIEYANKLASIVGDPKKYSHMSRSMALYNLQQIDKMATNYGGNTLSKAHKAHLRVIVDSVVDAD